MMNSTEDSGGWPPPGFEENGMVDYLSRVWLKCVKCHVPLGASMHGRTVRMLCPEQACWGSTGLPGHAFCDNCVASAMQALPQLRPSSWQDCRTSDDYLPYAVHNKKWTCAACAPRCLHCRCQLSPAVVRTREGFVDSAGCLGCEECRVHVFSRQVHYDWSSVHAIRSLLDSDRAGAEGASAPTTPTGSDRYVARA
jgi:hypothetical protein